jgi:hypothetical protein
MSSSTTEVVGGPGGGAPTSAMTEADAGREAVVLGPGDGPSPSLTLVTRHAAVLKQGCLETGSQTVIVSSLANR